MQPNKTLTLVVSLVIGVVLVAGVVTPIIANSINDLEENGSTLVNENYMTRLSKVTDPSVTIELSRGEPLEGMPIGAIESVSVNGQTFLVEDMLSTFSNDPLFTEDRERYSYVSPALFASDTCVISLIIESKVSAPDNPEIWGTSYGLGFAGVNAEDSLLDSTFNIMPCDSVVISSDMTVSFYYDPNLDSEMLPDPNPQVFNVAPSSEYYIISDDGDFVSMSCVDFTEHGDYPAPMPQIYTDDTPVILFVNAPNGNFGTVCINDLYYMLEIDSNVRRGTAVLDVVIEDNLLKKAGYTASVWTDSYETCIVPYEIQSSEGGGSGPLASMLTIVPLLLMVTLVIGAISFIRAKM